MKPKQGMKKIKKDSDYVAWVTNRALNGLNCLLHTNQFCLYNISCQGECYEKYVEKVKHE